MLNLKSRFAYGFPALALSALGITYYVYLPKFYSDVVGINLTLLGNIILFSRIWDAVSDPLIGALSDRTKNRFGRRRFWIGLGLPILLLTSFFLLSPPVTIGATGAVFWFGLLSFAFFLGFTMVAIPYDALGTELLEDYDDRTGLYAIRQAFFVAGTLLAAVLPVVIQSANFSLGSLDPERSKFFLLGIIYAILVGASIILCLISIKEPATKGALPERSLTQSIRAAKKNRPFMILLTAYTISGLGAALPATLIPFYVEYVLGSKDSSLYLLIYFGVGFLLLPIWVYLAKRLEKRSAWLIAMGINSGAFAGVLLLGHGDSTLYAILVALSAVGYGGTLILPSSMQADVLDYEQYERGARREGEFLGFWWISYKLAGAIGAGVALPILAWAGYEPHAVQNQRVVTILALLYAGVPTLCNIVAMLIAFRYPITRSFHGKIQEELKRRSITA